MFNPFSTMQNSAQKPWSNGSRSYGILCVLHFNSHTHYKTIQNLFLEGWLENEINSQKNQLNIFGHVVVSTLELRWRHIKSDLWRHWCAKMIRRTWCACSRILLSFEENLAILSDISSGQSHSTKVGYHPPELHCFRRLK
jgi:hypothetical protein